MRERYYSWERESEDGGGGGSGGNGGGGDGEKGEIFVKIEGFSCGKKKWKRRRRIWMNEERGGNERGKKEFMFIKKLKFSDGYSVATSIQICR